MKKVYKILAENDEVLKRVINEVPNLKIEITNNIFHDLMSCVIEQQIHYRSTKKIFQKALDAASIEMLTTQNFPKFEKKGLKNLKLSTKKYETILRVVDFFEKNKVDWQRLDNSEVRKTLSQIKGIGAWTIDMTLMYGLGRSNIFPADDYHIKLIMRKLYKIDTTSKVKAQMKAIAEKWYPYESYGTRYLLAWKEMQKKK